MKNKLHSLLALLAAIAVLLNLPALQLCGADISDSADIINQITEYKLSEGSYNDIEEWINGALTQSAGVDSEWYIIGLSRICDYDFSNYRKALGEYLSANEIGSASSRQKCALALIAAGDTDALYIQETLNNSIGEQGIMSLIFGLHLLNNGYISPQFTLQQVKQQLLSLQLTDGGFAVMGTVSDVDTTAMAISALASYYETDSDVKACIDTAIEFLSSKQNALGDFSSYGTDNAESTAQVLIALSSLGIDAVSDVRFIKNSNTIFDALAQYSLPSGGFSHTKGGEVNELATVQVFLGAISYRLMLENNASLYDFADRFCDESESDNVSQSESSYISNSDKDEQSVLTTHESQTQSEIDVPSDSANLKITSNYKIWAILAISIICLIVCVAMFALKRRNFKNYIVVIILALLCVIFVLATDFKTADEFYNANSSPDSSKYENSVTISISCDEIKDKNISYIPDDGIILNDTVIGFCDGESVYDILLRASSQNKIRIDASAVGKSVYIKGIADIYEFDFGELSGWMYYVNDEKPSVGCGEYIVCQDDVIEWVYTCDYTDKDF